MEDHGAGAVFSRCPGHRLSSSLANSHSMQSTGIGLALILGGAVGICGTVCKRPGGGFPLFYIGQYQWPAFNVADSAIVIGAGLLVIEILFAKSRASEKSA